MFPHTLETRCRKVLDDLLDFEVGGHAQTYDRIQITGTPSAQVSAPPPPGVNLGIDGDRCPPISVSPYSHFRWRFDHAESEDQALGILHAAERMLLRLRSPRSPQTADDETLMRQGVRSGEEIAETILTSYVEYDSDTVDLIEGLKPGTTRKVRQSNFCDDHGHPNKGVPKWLYDEFELLDSLGGREAVLDRFQIAQSTYYDVRSKIRKLRDAA